MPSIFGLNVSCLVGGSSDRLLQHVLCIFAYVNCEEGSERLKFREIGGIFSLFTFHFSLFLRTFALG